MDIAAIMALVDAKIKEEAEEAGQMTLGALIDALKMLPEDAAISWDFGGYPGPANSFRGYYEQLAFEPTGALSTVKEFLSEAQSACGETFDGYKGGEYLMHRGTLIWASEYGTSRDAKRIIGIEEMNGVFVIKTCEDEE